MVDLPLGTIARLVRGITGWLMVDLPLGTIARLVRGVTGWLVAGLPLGTVARLVRSVTGWLADLPLGTKARLVIGVRGWLADLPLGTIARLVRGVTGWRASGKTSVDFLRSDLKQGWSSSWLAEGLPKANIEMSFPLIIMQNVEMVSPPAPPYSQYKAWKWCNNDKCVSNAPNPSMSIHAWASKRYTQNITTINNLT